MSDKKAGIGIDPTSVKRIESLDDKPENNVSASKDSVIKKVVFTIMVILIMCGISYGLFFYLRLGQENKANANFSLNELEYFEGTTLPTDITKYGDFASVNIDKCKLDIKSVNVNNPGKYNYVVTCSKNKKTSTITIKEYNNLKQSTKIVYKTKGSSLLAKEFINNPNAQYTYTNAENVNFKNFMSSDGLYSVGINVKSPDNISQNIFGVLIVSSERISKILSCEKDNVSDVFLFNLNDYRLGNSLRIYKHQYKSEEELTNKVKTINNGKITLDNITGKVVYDYDDLTLSVITVLDNETLKQEYKSAFPGNKDKIIDYYQTTKKTTCTEN